MTVGDGTLRDIVLGYANTVHKSYISRLTEEIASPLL